MSRDFSTSGWRAGWTVLLAAWLGACAAADGPATSAGAAGSRAEADPTAAATTPASDALSTARLQAHVGFLADDLLAGRLTGTRGYDVAARYFAAELQALGLRPAAGDSYLLPVPFLASELSAEASALELTVGGTPRPLALGDDFVMRGSLLAEEVETSAPLVFVGHGVVAPEHGWDDYAGLDVRGKVVLVMSGGPAPFPSEQRAHHAASDTKEQVAAEHGAVGLVTFRSATDARRRSWERVRLGSQHPAMAWLTPEGKAAGVRPELRNHAMLREGIAGELFAAAGREQAEVESAAHERAGSGFELPASVRLKTVSRQWKLSSPNVGGILPGADPTRSGEVVVFTAHLDHLGEGEAVDGDVIYNGYYDNAMGVALLLEVARELASAPRAPARTLLFLAVTGEERGLLGSEQFAAHPPAGLGRLVANVNLDMPLFLHPAADLVAFGAEHSSLDAAAERAAARAGFVLSPDPMPDEVIFVRSDQYSFVRAGIPAVYLVPGTATRDPQRPGGEALQRFLAEHYHMPSDEVDLPVDWPTAVRFLRANAYLGRAIADAPRAPEWKPGDFFGEAFGRR